MNNHRNSNRLTILLRRTIVLICILSAGIAQYSLLFRKLQFTSDILSNGILLLTPPVSFGLFTKDVTSQPESFPKQSFQRAYEESLGFFEDVTEEEWIRRKKITLAQIHMVPQPEQQPDQVANVNRVTKIDNAPYWYATNWHPDFHCGYEDFIGLGGDGGKWVCDPHRLLQKEHCIIYSIGSNGKFDFEISVNQQLPHCEVHIFDFTDYSEAMTQANVSASYHVWGLGSSSGKANVRSKKHHRIFKSFRETVQELGHLGRTIDIFKIDCEECEWISYLDWFQNSGVEGIQQILLEAHYVPYPTAENMFQYLHDQGYVIFHKEPNIQFGGGNCVEFSFLRLNRTYFLEN